MTKNEWRETCLALADEFFDWATQTRVCVGKTDKEIREIEDDWYRMQAANWPDKVKTFGWL